MIPMDKYVPIIRHQFRKTVKAIPHNSNGAIAKWIFRQTKQIEEGIVTPMPTKFAMYDGK